MNDVPDASVSEATEATQRAIRIFRAVAVVAVVCAVGVFVYTTTAHDNSRFPFRLGLDLAGGSHLVYEADTSNVAPEEVPALMGVLKEVIERRVNVFGVSEPLVQVETSSFVTDEPRERLVVELPGITDVEEAVAEIGRTPLLEFRLIGRAAHTIEDMQLQMGEEANETAAQPFIDTGLTGRYLERAELVFGSADGSSLANEPIVSIDFNNEGAELFASITRANVGEQLAIFLDGELVSAPVINEAITGGSAVITGNFTPDEARALVQNLNFGALPLPIELQSTQTIGASLGAELLEKGIAAAAVGFSLVLLFMLVWYRLPGAVAGIALLSYAVIMLALFKLIPVTLTAAGLAGFILSLGMAVDANVLVFERMKEEYRAGKGSRQAARAGFARAWPAIRDGNVTSILSAIILFWFGTSMVKGFALVFGIGVLVSMLTALIVTRTLLYALPSAQQSTHTLISRLFGSGFMK